MERAQEARVEHNRVAGRHSFQDRHNSVHKRLYLHRPKADSDCYWDYFKVTMMRNTVSFLWCVGPPLRVHGVGRM